MKIQADFSDVKDVSFYVKPGTYQLKLKSVEETTSNAGNRTLVWQFEVLGMNALVNKRTALTKEAMGILKGVLDALTGKPVAKGVINFDPTQLVGRVCEGVIIDKTYEGEVYSEVKKLMPLARATGSTSSSAPSPSSAPAIDDLLSDLD